MTLVDEIRDGFASMFKNGAKRIACLPKEYLAYIIRIPDGYGVAIPVDNGQVVSEHFNSCIFKTGTLAIDNTPSNYLMLISAFEEFRYEFASLCAELLYPGEDGEARKALLDCPLDWWTHWKELVGNNAKDKPIYSIIAELLVLEHKFSHDSSAEWASARMGSHDIECSSESCEVKSTCKRYGFEVTIAGQHQLIHQKPLYLYFLRMEESLEGVSINDMIARLTRVGYDYGKLEIQLQQQGLEIGASIRDKKYKVLEKRKYTVDEAFPCITGDSFKDNRFPAGITQIIYTVDLNSIEYSAW